MQQFLREEEQLQLQLLEKEERENVKKLRDSEIQLTQQIRSLSKMIGQIESAFQNSTIESFEVRLNLASVWGKFMRKKNVYKLREYFNEIHFPHLKNLF